MRFLVDAQLPPALARWLTAQGHPSEHLAERGILVHGVIVVHAPEVMKNHLRPVRPSHGRGPTP